MPLVQCPECKKDISSTSAACPHCGFIGEPGSPNYERNQLEQFRQLQAVQTARASAVPISAAEMARLQRFGFPAFLSFFIPGLGQLVKGDIFRGIAFFFIAWLGIAMIFAVPGFGFLVAAGFWIWNIWDAYTPG